MPMASTLFNSPLFKYAAEDPNTKIIVTQTMGGKERAGPLLVAKTLKNKMNISANNVIMLAKNI